MNGYTPSGLSQVLLTGVALVMPWIAVGVSAALVLFFTWRGLLHGLDYFRMLAYDRAEGGTVPSAGDAIGAGGSSDWDEWKASYDWSIGAGESPGRAERAAYNEFFFKNDRDPDFV
jgi:hypothetical protein